MFERVLVGVDGRSGGEDAIALAKQLTGAPGRIVLVNVYGSGGWFGRGGGLAIAAERTQAHELLTRAREDNAVAAETMIIYGGDPGRALHELAGDEYADVLVIGSCHRGEIGQGILGNDTLRALNGSPCAVAIAPAGYASVASAWQKLGVGYDGSPESELALDTARFLASSSGGSVHVLSVVSLQGLPSSPALPDGWSAATEEAIQRERTRLAGIEGAVSDAVYGDPAEELARFAAGLDVLLVGSRGQGPWGRVMNGSTANYLARRCPCPLIVLPRCLTETAPVASDGPSRDLRVPARPAS
jgi:nucleotide-binding universal stress UspA family protein